MHVSLSASEAFLKTKMRHTLLKRTQKRRGFFFNPKRSLKLFLYGSLLENLLTWGSFLRRWRMCLNARGKWGGRVNRWADIRPHIMSSGSLSSHNVQGQSMNLSGMNEGADILGSERKRNMGRGDNLQFHLLGTLWGSALDWVLKIARGTCGRFFFLSLQK